MCIRDRGRVGTARDQLHARGGRVTLDLSDPEHVTGTELVHLGGSGANQRHYPDGSTSTQVTIRARLVNGVLIGTYSDKFQTGQLNWNVAPGK